VRQVFDYWKANLRPGGFSFSARIIDYPDGKPGDVGLFFGWPKGGLDLSRFAASAWLAAAILACVLLLPQRAAERAH